MTGENSVTYGLRTALTIIIADELGLETEYLPFAELYLKGKLHTMMYGRLDLGAVHARNQIINAGLLDKAEEIYQYKIKEYLKI